MPKKKATTPPAKDDLLDLAWRLAPYFDYQSWELRGCPPRKPIVMMMQEAREFVGSLCDFQEPNLAPGAGGREIVEEMLKNADLLVAATMTRGNGSVAELLNPEQGHSKAGKNMTPKNEPEVANRYGLAGSAAPSFTRSEFLPHIVVVRTLDLALAALERKAATPGPKIHEFLDAARTLDKKACKGVSCNLKEAKGPNRPQINPFISATTEDLIRWYTAFCEPLLGMMLGGPDPLDVRGRGNKSPITLLLSSIFWQAPGWVRFLKLNKGEELELWRYDQEETRNQYGKPQGSMPAWANADRMKQVRKELREYVKAAAKLITSPLGEKPAGWATLPHEAAPWLNDGGTSPLEIKNRNDFAENTKLDLSALRLLSEWATDFGFRYWWPVGIDRCQAMEQRVTAVNSGAKAIVARDDQFIADHRAWVETSARGIVKAAELANTDLCTASAVLAGAGSMRADAGPLSTLAFESAKKGLIASALATDEVRRIRLGLHPDVDSKSMKEQAIELLAKPEAQYRRLCMTFEFDGRIDNCVTRLQEKQSTPKKQEKHLAKIRAEIENLEAAASEAGIDLGLGPWTKTKGAVEKRLRTLRDALPDYRKSNPIALEDLDLVIAGADARVRVMESLLNLPPKKRKASDRKANAW